MQPKTISRFARDFGLSRATLLYYDRIGLLKPMGFNAAGYRLYGERERSRMARIETFHKAGLSLKAIKEILEDGENDSLEIALEERLVTLNEEMARLHEQQRLITGLLRREGRQPRYRAIDKDQWVAMLDEAGIDDAGKWRWHRAFERDNPEAHRRFLDSLGLSPDEIETVRQRSREAV